MAAQLQKFAFTGPNASIRVDAATQKGSVIEVVKLVTGAADSSNAQNRLKRIQEAYPELGTKMYPTQDQRQGEGNARGRRGDPGECSLGLLSSYEMLLRRKALYWTLSPSAQPKTRSMSVRHFPVF
jgi:hypothetical protein